MVWVRWVLVLSLSALLPALCVEVTELDTTARRGRRGRTSITSTFTMGSSNRAGNDELDLGEDKLSSCQQEAARIAEEIEGWKAKAADLLKQIEKKSNGTEWSLGETGQLDAAGAAQNKAADLNICQGMQDDTCSGDPFDESWGDQVNFDPTKVDKCLARGRSQIRRWELKKALDYHGNTEFYRTEPVCPGAGYRLCNFDHVTNDPGLRGLKDGCQAPTTYKYDRICPGQCVTTKKEREKQFEECTQDGTEPYQCQQDVDPEGACKCYDGWHSFVLSGDSDARAAVYRIMRALLVAARLIVKLVVCGDHYLKTNGNFDNPSCNDLINNKLFGGKIDIDGEEKCEKDPTSGEYTNPETNDPCQPNELGDAFFGDTFKRVTSSVKKFSKKVIRKVGGTLKRLGKGIMEKIRKKAVRFILKKVYRKMRVFLKTINEMGVTSELLNTLFYRKPRTYFTCGSEHQAKQMVNNICTLNSCRADIMRGWDKEKLYSPDGPKGNLMAYRVEGKVGHGEDIGTCTYEVQAIFKICNTCCCKDGLVSAPMQSQLVEDPDVPSHHLCQTWFVYVDSLFRTYFQWWRTLTISKRFILCENTDAMSLSTRVHKLPKEPEDKPGRRFDSAFLPGEPRGKCPKTGCLGSGC